MLRSFAFVLKTFFFEKKSFKKPELWKDGFPPITCMISPVSPDGHVPGAQDHPPAEFVESQFELERGDYKSTNASAVWNRLASYNTNTLMYSNERDVHTLTVLVMDDVISQLTKLTGIQAIRQQEEGAIFGLKPDIWLLTLHGLPVGVVEVKRPSIKDEKDFIFELADCLWTST